MKFENGHVKMGGRTAGTPNKAAKALRDQLQEVVQTTLDELPDTLAAMEPNERAKLLTALLPYVMPKLTSIDLNTQVEVPEKGRPAWLTIAADETNSNN